MRMENVPEGCCLVQRQERRLHHTELSRFRTPLKHDMMKEKSEFVPFVGTESIVGRTFFEADGPLSYGA